MGGLNPGLGPDVDRLALRLRAAAADPSQAFASPADLLRQVAMDLCRAGCPIDRLALALIPVADELDGVQHWWQVDEPERVRSFYRTAEFFQGADHRSSVLCHVATTGRPRRFRLERLDHRRIPFSLVADLRRERFSDYIAVPLGLSEGLQCIVTLSTRQPGGFEASDLRELSRLRPLLPRALRACRSARQHRDSGVDVLTQLPLAARFLEELEALRELIRPQPFTLLLLDLDAFTAYNRLFGHFCADEVLITVARCLEAQVAGSGELVARLGADSFALAWSGSPQAVDQTRARQVLATIEALRLAHPGAPRGPFLTASGVLVRGAAAGAQACRAWLDHGLAGLAEARRCGSGSLLGPLESLWPEPTEVMLPPAQAAGRGTEIKKKGADEGT